jgi:photosystem II stability/assembly factor-like uncharacterized protein
MRKIIFVVVFLYTFFINHYSSVIAQTGWYNIYNNQDKQLTKSYFINENIGFVVGATGSYNYWLILKTTNGGNNWIQQNGTFGTPQLMSVCFTDSFNGFIVGGDGMSNPVFFRTTNQGINWVNINLGYNSDYVFRDITFMNSNIGLISGTGIILRTTNGGNNWVQINCNVNVSLRKVAFAKSNSGLCYAVGRNSCILRSLDSGQTWNIQNLGSTDTIFTSISIVNDSICYISGVMSINPYYSVLYKTTNSGNNWINMSNTLPSYCKFTSTVYFFSDSIGLIASSGVYKTTTGGLNWKVQDCSALKDLFFLNQNFGIGVAGSTNGEIYKTTNGGEGSPNAPTNLSCTRKYSVNRLQWSDNSLIELGFKIQRKNLSDTVWTEIDSVGPDITSFNDSNSSENVNYRIYAFNELGNSSFSNITTPIILNINEQLIKEYYLLENYPNPFNPTTKIRFQLPVVSFSSLKIFDITGREVSTLVNEKLGAGTYEVTFNGGDFASGVYFYQLKTENFIETKKMILLK